MFTARTQDLLSRWRLPGLVLAIVLIVVGPFWLTRSAAKSSQEAFALVHHTREVEVQVYELATDIRTYETAVLVLAAGVDYGDVQTRMAPIRARIEPGLTRLQALTRDNPDQQIRIGALRALVAARLAVADRLAAKAASSSRADIETLALRNRIQPLFNAIIARERELLSQRNAAARRAERTTHVVAWTAMLIQLLLLGGMVYYAGRQLTQRLSAERETRSASQRAAAVLDTVREPIVLVDADLRVVLHNAAFSELYGVEHDLRGQPLAEIGGGAWRSEETLRRLADVLGRGRELWDYEQVQRTVDGIDRTMLINARRMPLPDSGDAVVLITASDVSAQKVSERQIRELARQLEGKVEQVSDVNRELEAFSYSVSHDLRAPLRHIAGFADKLGRHLGDRVDDKGRHYLDVIASSAKRMSALIDDLLVYSRLGRSALRMQPIDMQSMVAETRAMLDANTQAETPEHRIEWHIAPLPVVVGDENMLRQVWLNLLGNAVKYSARKEPAVIEVGYAREPDGGHRFTVRDNGAGFDMAYADKLFGVFQRLHSASEFPGTGIGLASVRRVLGRHGGRITAEGAPGRGATFHFTLPGGGGDAAFESRTP